jgi:plasmid stabilization system protein ParE
VRSVIILRRAEVELFDACKWYEEQRQGLSFELRKEIEDRLQIIITNPMMFPSRFKSDFRVSALKKFPYLIVYWYEKTTDTIFVTSIFHTKRNPEHLR